MRDTITHAEERRLGPALRHGWRQKCPCCGSGTVFDGYLKVRSGCDFCGLDLSQHRADDAPAWLTMLIVGHLVAPAMLTTYQVFDLPMWAHLLIWPTAALMGVVLLLPRIKSAIIAFQWAKRMHGFDD